MQFTTVTCPACFQAFEIAVPLPEELPADVDYDCEICCRPMVITIDIWDNEILVQTNSL